MVKTRSLTLAEMRTLSIFPSSYRGKQYLNVTIDGIEPEITWKLEEVERSRVVSRTLEGDTLETMAELYGPLDQLRFIGAFEDGTDDELIGLLTWRLEAWNQTVWLCDIRIQPDRRRQGIGGKLVDDLMWAAIRVDARGIMLETQNTNFGAVQFYLARGFQLVGLNSALYGDPGARNVDVALFFWYALG